MISLTSLVIFMPLFFFSGRHSTLMSIQHRVQADKDYSILIACITQQFLLPSGIGWLKHVLFWTITYRWFWRWSLVLVHHRTGFGCQDNAPDNHLTLYLYVCQKYHHTNICNHPESTWWVGVSEWYTMLQWILQNLTQPLTTHFWTPCIQMLHRSSPQRSHFFWTPFSKEAITKDPSFQILILYCI